MSVVINKSATSLERLRSGRFFGAQPSPEGTTFRVWAPRFQSVELVIVSDREDGASSRMIADSVTEGSEAHYDGTTYPMEERGDGLYEAFVPGIGHGTRYVYRVDGGQQLPDPASRFQPEGVHGPSMVVSPLTYPWQDEVWEGIPWEQAVFYELHVGAFAPEGTFDAVRQRLKYLHDLGVTVLELMPVADFPGRWNWGYDQAALYAPSHRYGSPDDLRRLVDEAHQIGLAVFLDVIYNHFGPDAAYAPAFGHFFSEKHKTPWGQSINLDGYGSEYVRAFFIDNALHWLEEYHFDGLRLDATHALVDDSPNHFLAELSEVVAALPGRKRYLVAEDHRNLRSMLLPREQNGLGIDAVWADDFHHQIRNLTAGDNRSYYADFQDSRTPQLAKTLQQGWFFTGQYSTFLKENRGTDPAGIPLDRFVICIQNHDQIGNRAAGDRLNHVLSRSVFKAASALFLFAPETPLIFMGQEWAAESPFQFFTDHNEELGPLVSEGRRKEFEQFESFQGEVPDPQEPSTFFRSKLNWNELLQLEGIEIHQFYSDLLALRKHLSGEFEVATHSEFDLVLRRRRHFLLVAFRDERELPLPERSRLVLHSEQPEYAATGRPPVIEAGRIRFQVPGAAIFVEDEQ